jgi:ketosteroid isomerase-like protein
MQNKIEEEKIRKIVENWAQAVRNRDIDTILAHHSQDIVMFDVPPPLQLKGIEAYRKTWDLFFKYTKPGVFDIQELYITAGENVAFCFVLMKCEDKYRNKDYIPIDFRLTIGLEKIDSQWTIIHEHHSVPSK